MQKCPWIALVLALSLVEATSLARPLDPTGTPTAPELANRGMRPAWLEADGAASLRALQVRVTCQTLAIFARTATCKVHVHGMLQALDAPVTWLLAGDGMPDTRTTLAPGEAASFEFAYEQSLATETGFSDDAPFILAPNLARHIVTSDGPGVTHFGGQASDRLLGGNITIEGPVTLEVDTASVQASLGAPSDAPTPMHDRASRALPITGNLATSPYGLSLGLWLPARDDPPGPVYEGGLVFTIGSRMALDHDASRLVLGLGYELGLGDHLVASAWLDTDFDALYEAIVLEVASPEVWVIVPSFSVGLGAVFRQDVGPSRSPLRAGTEEGAASRSELALHDAGAALRIRVGAQVFFVGFAADFDYWPNAGAWTATLSGRFSL